MATRITNPQDLLALRDRARSDIALRAGARELEITVHMGTCGIAAGARDVLSALAAELEAAGALDRVTLRQAGCAGLCDREPTLTLKDKDGNAFRYGKVDAKRVHRIVQEHVAGGNPVVELLIAE
jgi:NADP-reducing hydrogenase subunit HndB